MKAKQSVEEQVRSVLQKVHNDACKNNHLPELGYSERAYDLVMKLVFQELATLKAQVRKEIEGLKVSKADINWLYKQGFGADAKGCEEHNDLIDDCLSIQSLKGEE